MTRAIMNQQQQENCIFRWFDDGDFHCVETCVFFPRLFSLHTQMLIFLTRILNKKLIESKPHNIFSPNIFCCFSTENASDVIESRCHKHTHTYVTYTIHGLVTSTIAHLVANVEGWNTSVELCHAMFPSRLVTATGEKNIAFD